MSNIAGGSHTLSRRARIIVTRYSHVQVWVQCVARHQIVGIGGRTVHQCNGTLRPTELSGTKHGERYDVKLRHYASVWHFDVQIRAFVYVTEKAMRQQLGERRLLAL